MSQHLSSVLDLPDKSKVDLICRLVSCEMKQAKTSGKTYFNCKLADAQNGSITLYASFFGNTPAPFQGQTVLITGAEKGSYNGKPQISVGKFGKVSEWREDFEAAQTFEVSPPARHAYAAQAPKPAPVSPREQRFTKGTETPAMPLSGQTIGMSVKAAVDIYMHLTDPNDKRPWSDADATEVERIARDIIGISQRIEADPTNPNSVQF